MECAICGRQLKDKTSQKRGMGPKCYRKEQKKEKERQDNER